MKKKWKIIVRSSGSGDMYYLLLGNKNPYLPQVASNLERLLLQNTEKGTSYLLLYV